MMLQIKRWLAPPVFPEDEPKTRRAILLNFALLTCMVLALCLIAGNLAGGTVPPVVTGLDIVSVAVCLVLRRWANQGRVGLASGALLAVGLVGISMDGVVLGTIRTPSTAVYMLLVIFAGLMFDLGGMIAMTVLCSLAVAGLIVAENIGLLSSPDYSVTLSQWVTYTVLFLWVGSLTLSSLQSTRRALMRAEKEISERKQVEKASHTNEERLAHILETVPSGIAFVDRSGQITFANHTAEKILGLARTGITERVYNDPTWKITAVDGSAFPDEQLPFRRVMQTNEPVHGIEHAIEHPDGTRAILSVNAAPLCDAHGDLIGMVSALTDITDHKRTEVAQQESERRFREMLENVELIAVMLDAEGRVIFCNDYLLRLTGYSRAEVLGQNWFALFVPPESRIKDIFRVGMEQGTIVPHFENEILNASGVHLLVSWNNTILRDTEGDVIGITSIGEDITARKQAEEALRHSQEETAHANSLLIALSQAAQNVQRARKPEEVYRTVNEQMAQLGYKVTAIELDDEKEGLRIAYLNYGSDLLRKAEKKTGLSIRDYHIPLHQDGVYKRILAQGEAVYNKDAQTPIAESLPKQLRALSRPIIELFHFGSSIFAPLIVDGKVIGILIVTGPELTEADKPAITAFANQAAIATQNARLYEQAQQEITERKRMEEDLKESEAKYRSLIEQAWDGIFVVDSTGKMLLVNQQACQMLGYTQEELLQLNVADTYLVEQKANAIERIALMQKGEHLRYERMMMRKDGTFLPVDVTIGMLPSGFTQGIVRDITERKQAEQALTASELKFKWLYEYAPTAYHLLTPDGIITDVNRRWCDLLGYSRDEALGRAIFDFVIEDEREAAKSSFEKKKQSRQPYTEGSERNYKTKDGALKKFKTYDFFSLDERQNITSVQTTIEDITERKRAEEALRESEKHYHSLFENMLEGYSYCQMLFTNDKPFDFIYLNVNSAFEELTGLRNVIGKKVSDVIPGIQESTPEIFEVYSKVALTGKSERFETYIESMRIWLSISVYSTRKEYFVAVFDNITNRKRAEEALRESEANYRRLFENASLGIFQSTPEGKAISVNPAFARMFGYDSPADALLNIKNIAADVFEDPNRRAEIIHLMAENPNLRTFENLYRRKDGSTFIGTLNSQPIMAANGSLIRIEGIIEDITARKQVEIALQESRNLLEKTLASLPEAVFTLDADTVKIMDCNPAASTIFGYSRQEMLGRTTTFLHVDQAALEDFRQYLYPTVEEKGFLFMPEFRMKRKDGTVFPSEHSVVPLENEQGKLIGWVSVVRDITERKSAITELERSHDQLRALNIHWQNAIEDERTYFAREMHDEFGQSMTALKMDLAWLANRLPEEDEKVNRIRGMTTLVDESVALMRRIATEMRPALLDDLGLNAALEWQAQEFSKHSGIPCKLNLPKDDLALDPALNTTLFRIFQETLTNIARHAQATRVSASLKQKEQTLVLTLRDNGRGITEGELNNPRSLGLLGLRERATQWGGETSLRGVAGKGTSVTVRIPLPASPVHGGGR